MGRKVKRVPYYLDSGGVTGLPASEIAAILRGADTMIATGGRTQLSKLLKGSREKSVLDHGLDRCPSYGFYRDVPIDEVLRRIDWMIENEYLRIEYSDRLPVLVFTKHGWAIEVEIMAEELLRGFDDRLAAGPPYDFSDLKDRNREMIFLLLDKVAASRRFDFIPLLRAWQRIAYQKVQARIKATIRAISSPALPESGER